MIGTAHTFLSPLGRHEEAIAHGKRAKELDPLTPYIRNGLGWWYDHARRWDEAIAECEQIPEIDPNFYFAYWCLGFAYVNKGMYEEAIAAYQRGVELAPEDDGLKARPRDRLCALRAGKTKRTRFSRRSTREHDTNM